MGDLVLGGLLAFLKIGHNLKRSLKVFSGNRLFVFVSPNYFRNIVNIVARRIRIFLESMEFLSFRNLCDKAFETAAFFRFDIFFLYFVLFANIFKLLLFFFFLFPLLNFLFLLSLQVILHVRDLRL